MIKVALVTDSDLVAHGISVMVADSKISISSISSDHCEVFAQISDNIPDIVIIDLQTLGSPTLTEVAKTFRQFKAISKKIEIVSITDVGNKTRYEFCQHLGVKGFCLKKIRKHELITLINTVARGEFYVQAAYEKTIEAQNKLKIDTLFSDRQLEVLNLLLLGHTNNEIADILQISYETVRSHVKIILERLNARDRAQVVSMVLQDLVNLMNWDFLPPSKSRIRAILLEAAKAQEPC